MIYFLLNPPISPSQTQPGDPPPGRATRRAVRPARVTVGTAPLHPHDTSAIIDLALWQSGSVRAHPRFLRPIPALHHVSNTDAGQPHRVQLPGPRGVARCLGMNPGHRARNTASLDQTTNAAGHRRAGGNGARAATARKRHRHAGGNGTQGHRHAGGNGTRATAATCPMERECPRFAAASRRPPLANASDRQGLQAETYCCRRGTGLLRNAKAFSDVCNCRESGPLHSYISLLQGNV